MTASATASRSPRLTGPQPYFTQVPIQGQINLQVAATIAGITTKEIYRLNPAFHRWASDPTGPFYLLLPVDAAPVFEQNIADLTPDQRMGVEHYVVRRGDSIYSIARRFKTTVAILRRINVVSGGRLSVGDDIEVPATAYVLPEKVRLAAARVDGLARSRGNVQFQIVRRGDSLWRIAHRYGTTVHALARMNGISPHEILRPGERLRLYARAPVARHGHLRFEVVRRGDSPARILPPDRHDEIWAVQKPLNFPDWVYGVPRDTPDLMRVVTERLSRELWAHADDVVIEG